MALPPSRVVVPPTGITLPPPAVTVPATGIALPPPAVTMPATGIVLPPARPAAVAAPGQQSVIVVVPGGGAAVTQPDRAAGKGSGDADGARNSRGAAAPGVAPAPASPR
jgi:hypothetical protein